MFYYLTHLFTDNFQHTYHVGRGYRADDETTEDPDDDDDDDDDDDEDLAVVIVGSCMGGLVLVVLTGYIVVRARGGCVPQ